MANGGSDGRADDIGIAHGSGCMVLSAGAGVYVTTHLRTARLQAPRPVSEMNRCRSRAWQLNCGSCRSGREPRPGERELPPNASGARPTRPGGRLGHAGIRRCPCFIRVRTVRAIAIDESHFRGNYPYFKGTIAHFHGRIVGSFGHGGFARRNRTSGQSARLVCASGVAGGRGIARAHSGHAAGPSALGRAFPRVVRGPRSGVLRGSSSYRAAAGYGSTRAGDRGRGASDRSNGTHADQCRKGKGRAQGLRPRR